VKALSEIHDHLQTEMHQAQLRYQETVGITSRRSGVACRWKRHHSNGDDNAVESNGIATAVARGSWQRRLGILS